MSQRREYMRHNQPVTEVIGEIKHATNDAYLFLVRDEDEPIWFPASQVLEVHRERATTGYDRLVVTAWIAKKKGLYT